MTISHKPQGCPFDQISLALNGPNMKIPPSLKFKGRGRKGNTQKVSTHLVPDTWRGALPLLFHFQTTPQGKCFMIAYVWRKLMMQSSLREENLFWAGILLHGNRLEISTRMEVKGSCWEVIDTSLARGGGK